MRKLYRPGTMFLSRVLRILATIETVSAHGLEKAGYCLHAHFEDPGLPEEKRRIRFYLSEEELEKHWAPLEVLNG